MNKPLSRKPVIGILGGIGAGKSTTAGEFEQVGCIRIDADAIGHELLESEEVRSELREHFGEAIFAADGAVNRQALGEIVFGAPAELEALNVILHPRIRRGIQRRIADAQQRADAPAVVVDAAVLLDAGWDDLCTDLVFVDAPDELRAARAAEAHGWDHDTWRRRENSQISLDTKVKRCYYYVDNSSGVSRLREQVREVFHTVIHAADRP